MSFNKVIVVGNLGRDPETTLASLPPGTLSRFWSKVRKAGEDECWLWLGGKDQHGYGRMSSYRNHSPLRANRVSWLIHIHNSSLKSTDHVCHRCDNPSCVNPNHLFIGSQADNMLDMKLKGRAHQSGPKGEQQSQAKLSTDQVIEIMRALTHGEPKSALARTYRVSRRLIQKIASGERWGHITREVSNVVQ